MEKTEFDQKIAILRDKYLSSPESQTDIDTYEADIARLFEDSKLKQHPVFASIVEDAEKKINDINALLMNDQTLSDEQRSLLFRSKEIWKFVLHRFSLVPNDEAMAAMKGLLDSKLSQ